MSEYIVIGTIIAAFAVAAVLSYFFTPPVKNFAHKVGAIDVPKDARRMHKKPIPRLGGLAIYGGFLCSILIFGQLDETMLCVLLGAAIIVALGIFDDVLALGAKLKFVVQIVAAAIPVCIGDLQIGLFTNLNPLSDTPFVHLGILAVPVTIIWIVGITNAVNLIDGLDGLAVGVSSIAAITMLAVALLTGNMPIAITMAALAGACIGFMPYNLNPAKIFMGDTGSLSIGGIIAVFALCIRKELLLPLLCGVFLVESFSVMMQVGYFKYTKRKYGEGQRLLLMAPVHHHFQKKGQFETKIVLRFWIISLLLAAITLVTLKIR